MNSKRRTSSRESGLIQRPRQLVLGMRSVKARLQIFRSRQGFAVLLADTVDPGIAPGDNQPGGRVTRRCLPLPGSQGLERRFLKCVFGQVDVTKDTVQCGQNTRTGSSKMR